MGQYTEDWFLPVRISYGPAYLKSFYEPAIFAVCLGYRDALFNKMIECTLQTDLIMLSVLYCSEPLYIEINKGHLIVRNYNETEGENQGKETIRQCSIAYQ